MSIGKVTVWYMTEEERLAYIKKHPIVPTEKDDVKFSTDRIDYKVTNERKKAVFKGKTVMDGVDLDLLHKLYIAGETLPKMAKALNINTSTMNNYIYRQRNIEPEKWPRRAKKR